MIGTSAEELEHVPIEVRVPPGFWRRDDTHMPLPVTPMTDSVFDNADMFAAACTDFGLLVEPRIAGIGGWRYIQMAPVGAKPGAATPPGWLLPLLLRLSPEARTRVRRCRLVARTGYVERVVDTWHAEQRDLFERRIAVVRAADSGSMPDPQLIAHVADALTLAEDGLRTHFRVNVAHWLAMGELSAVCRDLLGWGQPEVTSLLAGLSARSSEPARRLSALAGKSPDSPEFQQYLRVYGCRSLTLEMADPTVGELPAVLWAQLRDQVRAGYDPATDEAALADRRAEAAAQARKALKGQKLARFERALALAVKAYPVREDNVFFTGDAPIALMRYAVLEVGERLQMRGQLDEGDDVFFLSLAEALDALGDHEGRQTLVTLRKAEHEWALANPGPPTYGRDPGPPPSTRWLRSAVRASVDAMHLVAEQVLAADLSNRTPTAPATTLTGIAGSPGRYRGPVRVIASEREFDKLHAGDVLVCAATRPSWSVLFPSVGAIVTDAGGTLSHPAIIAREHRVPAVVATGYATQILRDGQVVTVDGTRGVVEVEA